VTPTKENLMTIPLRPRPGGRYCDPTELDWPTLLALAKTKGVRVHRTRPGHLPVPVTDISNINPATKEN